MRHLGPMNDDESGGRRSGSWLRRLWSDERGMVTIEAAYVIAAIVGVVVLGIGAIVGASVQIRCTDAAREAARLTAAGDPSARTVAARLAGDRARISITDNGAQVVVEVRSSIPLIGAIEMSAYAVAAKEPAAAAAVAELFAEAPP